MDFMLSKLKEKSTYAGLAALLAAYGWSIDPDTFAAGSAAVIALVGLWEVLRRESK
jgi:exopolyphosphatase/pppGpp-phosphohydrolase